MTDEEIDEFYRPKKTNSRKSLAPLFVFMVLRKASENNKALSQSEILDALKEYPYEISIERKAISRILHSLHDSGIGIINTKTMGSWYDKNALWNDDNINEPSAEYDAVYEDGSYRLDVSPKTLIDGMFNLSKPDGIFVCDEPFDDITFGMIGEPKIVTIKWSEEDRDNVKEKCSSLLTAITAYSGTKDYPKTIAAYLDPFDVDLSFLVDLGYISKDDLNDADKINELLDSLWLAIYEKKPINGHEAEAIERIKTTFEKEAELRIGKGPFSYNVIEYARRLHALLGMGAPQKFIDNERNGLAQAMVIHDYAIRIETL